MDYVIFRQGKKFEDRDYYIIVSLLEPVFREVQETYRVPCGWKGSARGWGWRPSHAIEVKHCAGRDSDSS